MVKHNNVVPNGHFKKHWQNYVKTSFNQPARKTRRHIGINFVNYSPAVKHLGVFLFPFLLGSASGILDKY